MRTRTGKFRYTIKEMVDSKSMYVTKYALGPEAVSAIREIRISADKDGGFVFRRNIGVK